MILLTIRATRAAEMFENYLISLFINTRVVVMLPKSSARGRPRLQFEIKTIEKTRRNNNI